jgi:hypothetical protein
MWLGIIQEPVQWLAEPAYTLPIAMLMTILIQGVFYVHYVLLELIIEYSL